MPVEQSMKMRTLMALMNCPECHKPVSDTCKRCIHCGYKLHKFQRKDLLKYKKSLLFGSCFLLVIIVLLVRYLFTPTPEQEVKETLLIQHDEEPPIISCKQNDFTFYQYDIIDRKTIFDFFSITDNVDGTIAPSSLELSTDLDTSKVGTYHITVTAKDHAGNQSAQTITIHIKSKYTPQEIKLYTNAVIGYYSIREIVKSPASLKIYGIKYHTNGEILFKYGATNSFNAEITNYTVYNADLGLVTRNAEKQYYASDAKPLDWNTIVAFSNSPYLNN